MGRFYRFSGVQKAIANLVAQTIVFPAAEIESAGVVKYMIAISAGTIADINRVRVKAGGSNVVDIRRDHLQAFQQRFYRSNLPDATAGKLLTIPLNFPHAPTEDEQDLCQFPLGASAQVEIEFAATIVAGAAIIGYEMSDVDPLWTPRLYGSQMNIPASSTNAKYAFAESGIIAATVCSQTGISKSTLSVSSRNAMELPGPVYSGLALGNLIDASQFDSDGNTSKTILARACHLGIAAAQGSSQLMLDTSAAWPGVTEELTLWAIAPQGAGPNVGGNAR